MNIKSLLKKYGILMLIALLFVGAIVYFAYDSNKGKIAGKKVNGKDVVVALKGFDITADDLYADMLESQYGPYGLFMFYERAVVAAAMEATDDMKTNAKLQTEQFLTQFKAENGDNYKDVLIPMLQGAGLQGEADLPGYYLHYIMRDKLIQEYLDANFDTLVTPYVEEKQPRLLRHILVKMKDPNNPTAEEQAKWDTVKQALADGKDFGEVAKEYSDDTGSAASKGELGFSDNDTSYVKEFLNAAAALENQGRSEWVKSEYGYHIIECMENRPEELKENTNFIEALKAYHPSMEIDAIIEAAKDKDISFTDPKLQELLDTYIKNATATEEEE